MKKLIIAAMALTCATAIVSADTVTSENIVGYNKFQIKDGLQMPGLQFIGTGDSTPESLFGDSLPVGSKVYIWGNDGTNAGYVSTVTYIKPPFPPGAATKWDDDPVIPLGAAYWVRLPADISTNIEVVISGDVLMNSNKVVTVEPGLQLICNPYPVALTVGDLDITPSIGDKVYIWENDGTNAGYVATVTYVQPPFPPGALAKWDDSSVVIGVGQGFWYKSADSGSKTLTWTRPSGIE